MRKTLASITVILMAQFLFSCDKKYICRCTGYEGLNGVERYKYRSENLETANATCKSYEQGTISDGTTCDLE
ncbi:MAG: hypothetical protein IPM77_03040 [Crocinitomicaceae bacterium]|nr:hypothetical protein [Crocinitomicaceae bacterium]